MPRNQCPGAVGRSNVGGAHAPPLRHVDISHRKAYAR